VDGYAVGELILDDQFTLGDLRIGEVLGRGATGEVRRATGPNGEIVAVKLLRKELADDPQVVARLLQECSVVARLADPRVIRIRHLIAENDRVGIVMEYLPDGDVRGLLRRRGTLTPADAARLTGQVLAALRRAHAAGVVHRDIKPENVLLRGDDAVLTDFGIARQLESPALTTGTGILGTPAYLAPELASDLPTTPAVDLYSTGCLFYELLTGAPPFVGGPGLALVLRHVNEAPARPADLPDRLWDLLAGMLDKQPDRRPSAAEAIAALRALEPVLAGLPARPRRAPADDSANASPGATHGSVPTWSQAPGWDLSSPHRPTTRVDLEGWAAAQADAAAGHDAVTAIPLRAGAATADRTGGPWADRGYATPALDDQPTRLDGLGGDTRSWSGSGGPAANGAGTGHRPGAPRGRRRRRLVLLLAAAIVLALAGTSAALVMRPTGNDGAPRGGPALVPVSTGPTDLATSPTATAPTPGPTAVGLAQPTPTHGTSAPVTTPPSPPAAPVLNATSRAGSVWLAISQPDGGPVDSYQIAATGLETKTISANKATVAIKVNDCNHHTLTATAVGPGGTAASDPVDAVGCVAPGAVQNLAQTGVGAHDVVVSWQAPGDLGGDTMVTYLVTVTRPGMGSTGRATSGTSSTINCDGDAGGCPTGTTVSVQARNSVGTGPRARITIQATGDTASASPSP